MNNNNNNNNNKDKQTIKQTKKSKTTTTTTATTKSKKQQQKQKLTTKPIITTKTGGAYGAAQRKQWLEEVCSHMLEKKLPAGFWTKQRCAEEVVFVGFIIIIFIFFNDFDYFIIFLSGRFSCCYFVFILVVVYVFQFGSCSNICLILSTCCFYCSCYFRCINIIK